MTAAELKIMAARAVEEIAVHPGWTPDPRNPYVDDDGHETIATHSWKGVHDVRISAVLNMENGSDGPPVWLAGVEYEVGDDDVAHLTLGDFQDGGLPGELADWLGRPPEQAPVRIAMLGTP